MPVSPVAEGEWISATVLTTAGTTIATCETNLDEIVAGIQAADAGWTIATATTQYGSSKAVYARLTHTDGQALCLVTTIAAGYVNDVIHATNMNTATAVNGNLATGQGNLYIAWQPAGVTAPTGTPDSGTFFAASTDTRFQLANYNASAAWLASQRRIAVVSQEGALGLAFKPTPATPTYDSVYIAGSDLYSTISASDTNTGGSIVVQKSGGLSWTTPTFAGQCLNQAGTALVQLNTISTDTGLLVATAQAGPGGFAPTVNVARIAADIGTTGVRTTPNGNGWKGAINSYYFRAIITATSAQQVISSDYLALGGGLAFGWKSTNSAPS